MQPIQATLQLHSSKISECCPRGCCPPPQLRLLMTALHLTCSSPQQHPLCLPHQPLPDRFPKTGAKHPQSASHLGIQRQAIKVKPPSLPCPGRTPFSSRTCQLTRQLAQLQETFFTSPQVRWTTVKTTYSPCWELHLLLPRQVGAGAELTAHSQEALKNHQFYHRYTEHQMKRQELSPRTTINLAPSCVLCVSRMQQAISACLADTGGHVLPVFPPAKTKMRCIQIA